MKERPKRKRKPKSYKEDYDSEENERPSDRDSNDTADSLFGDENVDDPDFDEEMSDDDDNFSLDMFYSDEEEHDLDMSLVKEEIDTIQVWSCNCLQNGLEKVWTMCNIVNIPRRRMVMLPPELTVFWPAARSARLSRSGGLR